MKNNIKINTLTGKQCLDIIDVLKDTDIDPDIVNSYSVQFDRGWIRIALFDVYNNVLEVKEKKWEYYVHYYYFY